jgi:predicted metal-dependent TIM-barrel fold hydrolase
MMLDALRNRPEINPDRVCFDHVEEHTMGMIRDAGFWGSMTIYPITKNSPARVIDTVERFGLNHILVDASGDWGPSDPATLHNAVFEMRRRGYDDDTVESLFYDNPCRFLGQNAKFKPRPRPTGEW